MKMCLFRDNSETKRGRKCEKHLMERVVQTASNSLLHIYLEHLEERFLPNFSPNANVSQKSDSCPRGQLARSQEDI